MIYNRHFLIHPTFVPSCASVRSEREAVNGSSIVTRETVADSFQRTLPYLMEFPILLPGNVQLTNIYTTSTLISRPVIAFVLDGT